MAVVVKALNAWHDSQVLARKQQAERLQRIEVEDRKWLKKTFGDADLIAQLAQEGHRARVMRESDVYDRYLQIEVGCRKCKRRDWSTAVKNWAQLGEMIENPMVSSDHRWRGCY